MSSTMHMAKQSELSQAEAKLINEMTFEKLNSGDPMLFKEAVDAIDEFTRVKVREDGYMRQILPAQNLTNDDLDRSAVTDKPIKIVDKEPGSPAAISVPYATLPMNVYIRGPRYVVHFERILTPRFTKDVSELRTWIMDIRQVLSDNSIKDMLAEEDGKFMTACNTAVGTVGTTMQVTGTIQNRQIGGGISRDGLFDMLKIMPESSFNLEVQTILLNHITINDLAKFGRDEMGGDLSQDIMRNGWTETTFMGRRLVVTIKKSLVPTNVFYHYADPKFIGKHYMLEDVKMYIRREAYMIEFFSYQESGATLGHTAGITRAEFI